MLGELRNLLNIFVVIVWGVLYSNRTPHTEARILDKYQKKYEAKRAKMTVSFNVETEADLLAFAKTLNFSEWAKKALEAEKNKCANI